MTGGDENRDWSERRDVQLPNVVLGGLNVTYAEGSSEAAKRQARARALPTDRWVRKWMGPTGPLRDSLPPAVGPLARPRNRSAKSGRASSLKASSVLMGGFEYRPLSSIRIWLCEAIPQVSPATSIRSRTTTDACHSLTRSRTPRARSFGTSRDPRRPGPPRSGHLRIRARAHGKLLPGCT